MLLSWVREEEAKLSWVREEDGWAAAPDTDGAPMLYNAAFFGRPWVARALTDAGADPGWVAGVTRAAHRAERAALSRQAAATGSGGDAALPQAAAEGAAIDDTRETSE